ncbi:MAG TPA: PDZ domain-containing protein [Blastocatellia bacterium]|nr:PDZ domain-containing protein [Blastocatellia bacterium]
MLLACAAACGSACSPNYGSAFAQSTQVLQQAPQSDSKTSGSETLPNQVSGSAYLGVYLGDVTADRASALGLKEIRGAVVGSVEEGSPAAKVGLKEDDVILTINARHVHNRGHFHSLLMDAQPGSKVSLGISRNGVAHNLEVVLGQSRSPALDARQKLYRTVNAVLRDAEEREKQAREAIKSGDEKAARGLIEEAKMLRQVAQGLKDEIDIQIRDGKIVLPSPSQGAFDIKANRHQIGVRVIPLTGQLAGFFNLTKPGVLITEVSAGELGETAGLKAGDCIVTVEGEAVKSASELNRLVGQKGSGEVEFVIVRDRGEQKIKIKLDQK